MRRNVVDRRGCEEDLLVDRDVEENLVLNVDVEVFLDELCDVLLLLLSMFSSRPM